MPSPQQILCSPQCQWCCSKEALVDFINTNKGGMGLQLLQMQTCATSLSHWEKKSKSQRSANLPWALFPTAHTQAAEVTSGYTILLFLSTQKTGRSICYPQLSQLGFWLALSVSLQPRKTKDIYKKRESELARGRAGQNQLEKLLPHPRQPDWFSLKAVNVLTTLLSLV